MWQRNIYYLNPQTWEVNPIHQDKDCGNFSEHIGNIKIGYVVVKYMCQHSNKINRIISQQNNK